MKSSDVFTPGKHPTITFISDHLEEKSRHLREAIATGGLVISLSGPSKSGKTVFIEKVIGKDSLIHVTGAGITNTSKFWERVFDIIGTPLSVSKSQNKGFEGTISAKAGAGIDFLVKAGGEVEAAGTWAHGSASSEQKSIDYLQTFIREVRDSGFVLFIDDFHYIEERVQKQLAEEIKESIRHGIVIICASVPYHSEDVIRANKDLRGRIVTMDFDYWTTKLLEKIADIGFRELKIDVESRLVERLANESAGSPQLMQSLCLNLCYELGVYNKQEDIKKVTNDINLIRRICIRTATMTDYSSTVAMMQEGPKTRGQDRKPHQLKNEEILDVYPIILRAIAQDPPELTFRYNGLLDRIQKICKEGGPVGSSVTGACWQMAKIGNEAANSAILEWDAEHDVLDIRDPYLLFYLRWADWP